MSDASVLEPEGGQLLAFRLDNEQLAFRFTATISNRYATPAERLPTPARLDDWLDAAGIRLGAQPATPMHLDLAHQLREAIHRTGTATATGSDPHSEDIKLINELAAESESFPELASSGLTWRTRSTDPVRAALGLIAQHAITLLGGENRERIKRCENPECGGLYVDNSRGRNRRWCSMNYCGNRAKKAKFRGTTHKY